MRTAFRKPELVTTWEVVCSGFFDSVGLYSEVRLDQLYTPFPLAASHTSDTHSATSLGRTPLLLPLR